MGFNCGIVGLPNVGKSTLFNALASTAAAAAANYPFCTIEPNLGRVPVPDPRLEALARLARSPRIVPTQLEVVDIAGLVRGASRGEGLGNRFLGAIREVDAILHVLRCFEDPDIVHVEGGIDPVRDAELVLTELMLADLDSLVRQRESLQRRVRGGDKTAAARLALVERLIPVLEDGRPASTCAPSPAEAPLLAELQLITAKPVLYVLNVEEASARAGNAISDRAAAWARSQGAASVVVSAAIEAELAALDPADRATYLASLGLESPGLERVVRAGYGLLGLLTFFTAGPKETRAWTVRKGATAPEAAGVIHSDFQRGFIAAEVIAYADYLRYGGEQGAKEAGRMRLEGRDYRIADGDVCNFRFNV